MFSVRSMYLREIADSCNSMNEIVQLLQFFSFSSVCRDDIKMLHTFILFPIITLECRESMDFALNLEM